MLLQKTSLLTEQINTLHKINIAYEKQDSLRLEEINLCKNSYNDKSIQYEELKKKYSKYKRWSIVGGIAIFCLGVFVCR